MSWELTDFQLLTAGLYSGDAIKVRINFRVMCSGIFCYAGWGTTIDGSLDGQTAHYFLLSNGAYGGRDTVELAFTGKMPAGRPLKGKLVFKGNQGGFPTMWQFAEKELLIPNLDTVAPPGGTQPLPAICTEGQTKCVGFDQYVCRRGSWVVNEYNASACGYTVAPICREGETRCVGTTLQKCVNNSWKTEKQDAAECGYLAPTPPIVPPSTMPGEGGWFERNKTTIIIISVAVLAIALIALLVKRKTLAVRSPVTGVQSPLYRPTGGEGVQLADLKAMREASRLYRPPKS